MCGGGGVSCCGDPLYHPMCRAGTYKKPALPGRAPLGSVVGGSDHTSFHTTGRALKECTASCSACSNAWMFLGQSGEPGEGWQRHTPHTIERMVHCSRARHSGIARNVRVGAGGAVHDGRLVAPQVEQGVREGLSHGTKHRHHNRQGLVVGGVVVQLAVGGVTEGDASGDQGNEAAGVGRHVNLGVCVGGGARPVR